MAQAQRGEHPGLPWTVRHTGGEDILQRARYTIGAHLDADEARLGERQICIQRELRDGPIEVREGDAASSASRGGLGDAGVASEEKLAVEVEQPERESGPQSGDRRDTYPELRSTRADQRIDARDGISALRIDSNGGAARVVAVKAEATANVHFAAR